MSSSFCERGRWWIEENTCHWHLVSIFMLRYVYTPSPPHTMGAMRLIITSKSESLRLWPATEKPAISSVWCLKVTQHKHFVWDTENCMHDHVLAPVLGHINKQTVSLTLVLGKRSRVGAFSYHTLTRNIAGIKDNKPRISEVSYLISMTEARW